MYRLFSGNGLHSHAPVAIRNFCGLYLTARDDRLGISGPSWLPANLERVLIRLVVARIPFRLRLRHSSREFDICGHARAGLMPGTICVKRNGTRTAQKGKAERRFNYDFTSPSTPGGACSKRHAEISSSMRESLHPRTGPIVRAIGAKPSRLRRRS